MSPETNPESSRPLRVVALLAATGAILTVTLVMVHAKGPEPIKFENQCGIVSEYAGDQTSSVTGNTLAEDNAASGCR